MRTITILLTKHRDRMSKFLYYLSWGGYTHSSISLDDGTTYYSFNFRGFCIETKEKHKRHGVTESICFQINVSEEVYAHLKERITHFEENREKYRYTLFGVICCIFKLPFVKEDNYFCSQFIAELLLTSGAVDLKKSACLYLPNQFYKELKHCVGLERTIDNPI